MTAIDAIRRVKWRLVGVLGLGFLALLAGLAFTQGEPLRGVKLAGVYGAGFVVAAAFFPLCYLSWFGKTEAQSNDPVLKFVFWLFAAIFALFFARVLLLAVWR